MCSTLVAPQISPLKNSMRDVGGAAPARSPLKMQQTPSLFTVQNTSSRTHSSSRHGQIQLIFGPMFSGKTTELIRRINRYTIAKENCLLIKYYRDDRYDVENASTHDRFETQKTSRALSTVFLTSLLL